MPTNLPKHPALIIRSLLVGHWRPENTGGLGPNIPPREPNGLSMNRGWYSSVDYDPHVSITFPSDGENIENGGTSGYSGIDPSGAGPTQTRIGHPTIDVFAEGDRTYGTVGLDAAGICRAIRVEVEDIIGAAQGQGEREVPMPDAFESLSSSWMGNPNDTSVTPTVYRSRASVVYSWERWS